MSSLTTVKVPTPLAELAQENQRFINGTVIRSRGDILAPKKFSNSDKNVNNKSKRRQY